MQSLWMLVAAAFYAVMSAFVKSCSLETGTFEIVFFRSMITVVCIYVMMRSRGIGLATKHPFCHGIRSLTGAVACILWFASIGHLPLGTSVTLSYTGPLFIATGSISYALWHREKAPWLLGCAIVLGFIGVCLISRPSINPEQILWLAAALSAGFCSSIVFTMVRLLGRLGEPNLRIIFYFASVATILGASGMFIFEGGVHAHSASLWLKLLCVGLCSACGQIALTRAYAQGNLMLSACLHFSTIPMAELLSFVVFGEHLPIDALFGMFLIIGAGTIATVSQRRKKVA